MFEEFLSDKSYDYKTETEKAFELLKRKSEKESYFNLIEQEYNLLYKEFELNKKNDLVRNKKVIKEIINQEISGRYFYQEGEIRTALSFDNDVKKAIDYLLYPNLYDAVLSSAD
jgi:carboxyl-terminal processing protease